MGPCNRSLLTWIGTCPRMLHRYRVSLAHQLYLSQIWPLRIVISSLSKEYCWELRKISCAYFWTILRLAYSAKIYRCRSYRFRKEEEERRRFLGNLRDLSPPSVLGTRRYVFKAAKALGSYLWWLNAAPHLLNGDTKTESPKTERDPRSRGPRSRGPRPRGPRPRGPRPRGYSP